jgi:hypothetical protein
MLKHPTLEKLYAMKLFGMAKVFKEQMNQPEADGDLLRGPLALLVDRRATERENRRLRSPLEERQAQDERLRRDIDRSPRAWTRRC